MDNLPPGPYYVDTDDQLCDADGNVILVWEVPSYQDSNGVLEPIEEEVQKRRQLLKHLCAAANAHEALVTTLQQIRDNHSRPHMHRHGSTTWLCETALAKPQAEKGQDDG